MDEMCADKELRLAIRELTHGMGVPDFFEEGFWLGGHGRWFVVRSWIVA